MLTVNQIQAENNLYAPDDFPIWEIHNFDLPEITFYIDQPVSHNNKRFILQEKTGIDAFVNTWEEHFTSVLKHVQDSNLPVVEQTWKGRFETVKANRNVELFLDKPQFSMGDHVDNRNMVAVLIINLKDNIGAGTHFREAKYTSPSTKGSGVFFLNHTNTIHSIDHKGTEDRLIGYNTIDIDQLILDEGFITRR